MEKGGKIKRRTVKKAVQGQKYCKFHSAAAWGPFENESPLKKEKNGENMGGFNFKPRIPDASNAFFYHESTTEKKQNKKKCETNLLFHIFWQSSMFEKSQPLGAPITSAHFSFKMTHKRRTSEVEEENRGRWRAVGFEKGAAVNV